MPNNTTYGHDNDQECRSTIYKLERVRQYHEAGIALTPVEARSKRAFRDAWPDEVLLLEELERIYNMNPDLNIGGLMGKPSGNLVDVDLDRPEAILVADLHLPPTEAVFGKSSTPLAHRLYYLTGDLKTETFKLPPLGSIVEIRFTGVQTVLPGSIHASGEPIEWAYWDGKNIPHITTVDAKDLRLAVALIATTAALGHFYPPKGTRHDYELAVAGGLMKVTR